MMLQKRKKSKNSSNIDKTPLILSKRAEQETSMITGRQMMEGFQGRILAEWILILTIIMCTQTPRSPTPSAPSTERIRYLT
jgi:hypothetical protein